ncbi:unnamed protein product [Boreogadus saida]
MGRIGTGGDVEEEKTMRRVRLRRAEQGLSEERRRGVRVEKERHEGRSCGYLLLPTRCQEELQPESSSCRLWKSMVDTNLY